MYHRLYCHIVWTTREREPLIDSGLARFLTRYLRTIARQERAHILEIGMVATHIHLLMRIDQGTSLPRLLQRLKGGTGLGSWRPSASTSAASRGDTPARPSRTGVAIRPNTRLSDEKIGAPRQFTDAVPSRGFTRVSTRERRACSCRQLWKCAWCRRSRMDSTSDFMARRAAATSSIARR